MIRLTKTPPAPHAATAAALRAARVGSARASGAAVATPAAPADSATLPTGCSPRVIRPAARARPALHRCAGLLDHLKAAARLRARSRSLRRAAPRRHPWQALLPATGARVLRDRSDRSSHSPRPALRTPPVGDALVIAGQQDIGDSPAAELRRSRVVRILEPALELFGERLVLARSFRERPRQPARDRIEEHHRRQLAAGQNIRPDRNGV